MTTETRVSESERLARRVREALGEFDNKEFALTLLVEDLAAKYRRAAPLLEGGKGEPWAVACVWNGDGIEDSAWIDFYTDTSEIPKTFDNPPDAIIPLYTAPQPAAPQPAEPVAGGAVDARIADLSALRSSVQSMRDRMMRLLPEHFGDGFDGDYDTMLEVIIWIKSAIAALRANAGGVRE